MTTRFSIRRREFFALFGGVAIGCPLAAHAQRAVPVIGFLSSGSPETYSNLLTAFRQGLDEAGFIEPQNVKIEFRWARDQLDRLPALAAELAGQNPTLIIASGGIQSASAAKAATSAIPIVFTAVSDPVRLGLVASLNRPGGNVTGINALTAELDAKRLQLLRELVPSAEVIGVLINPTRPDAGLQIEDIKAAARSLGQTIVIAGAGNPRDIKVAIEELAEKRIGALLVAADPLFLSQRERLIAVTVQKSLPSCFQFRDFAVAGGLMSYGSRLTESYRQAGIYAGRILKGEKPADLPVQQPTKFELAINLKTAKAIGLTIPESFLLRADVVIE
jgi:putative ABC transport system substrate-binding protein